MGERGILQQVMHLAATQFGVVTRRQARILGMSDDAINGWLDRGLFVPLHRGTYRIAAVPRSYHQAVWAACSRTRGVASHRSSLKLWELDGYEGDILEVTRSGSHHRCPKRVQMHTTNELPPRDIQTLGPIRLTTPTRTLIDLGAVLPEIRVEEALESALRQGLTSVPRLRGRLEELGGPGRRGSGVLRRLLGSRDAAQRPTGSTFEVRLARLLARHGLPTPVRQFEIFDGDHFVARPDFCYPELKIAIEAQSVAFHLGRRRGWLGDMGRINRLQTLGWIVIQVPWVDLVHQPDVVVTTVRAALEVRTLGHAQSFAR